MIKTPFLLPVVALAVATGPAHSLVVTESFSSYGSQLVSGASSATTDYTWDIFHSAGATHALTVSGGNLRLAGYEKVHPNTISARATAIYHTDARPGVDGFVLAFNYHEYHDRIRVEVKTESVDPFALEFVDYSIVAPSTGSFRLEFGNDRVIEYVNNVAQKTMLYSSLGIEPTDFVDSFSLQAYHLNNGNDVAEISNLQITAFPVPEPGVTLLALMGIVPLLTRRRTFR